MSHTASHTEGHAYVPGGELHYRLAGPVSAKHLLVFENGWSGSFPYAAWLEQALAPRARILFYDRAGIADSRSTAPPSTAGLTQQLMALLSGLGIRQPVVVVGHSYGGLIGALHAAQSPGLVQSIVQIDPTPEFPDELIDPSLKLVPRLARILQLLTLLRVDDPVIAQAARELPPEVVARLRRRPLAAVRSLNGAIAEIHLLQEIRRVVAASEEARQCPRLVISAAPLQQGKNWLRTLLGKDRQEQEYTAAAHALHRRHAAQNDASRWTTLPYGHVGLVTNRSGADSVAAEIVRFLS